MKIVAHLIFPGAKQILKETGLNDGGKVQKYIDSFVFNKSEPYLPGHHIYRESEPLNKPGSGHVIWSTPDVMYLYYGKLMVDPETGSSFARRGTQKIMDPKNRDLVYHGGGLRREKWDERFLAAEMDNLIEGVQKIVDGGNS